MASTNARKRVKKVSAADIDRMARTWDSALASRDVDTLLDLYGPDAVIESPLIRYLLGKEEGICRGREEMRPFYEKVAQEIAGASQETRPLHGDDPIISGNRAIWENPRVASDGQPSDTSSFVEVWVVQDGLIQRHHAYWGWDRMANRTSRQSGA